MNAREQGAWPPVATDTFEQLRPALAHVRVMYRFLHEVIATDPELAPLYDRLLSGYVDLLQKQLAPHAFDMASLIVALEDDASRRGESG